MIPAALVPCASLQPLVLSRLILHSKVSDTSQKMSKSNNLSTQEGAEEDEGTALFVPVVMLIMAMLAMISNGWTYYHLNKNFTATRVFFRVLKLDAGYTFFAEFGYIFLSVGSLLKKPNCLLCVVGTIFTVVDFFNLFVGRFFIHLARYVPTF